MGRAPKSNKSNNIINRVRKVLIKRGKQWIKQDQDSSNKYGAPSQLRPAEATIKKYRNQSSNKIIKIKIWNTDAPLPKRSKQSAKKDSKTKKPSARNNNISLKTTRAHCTVTQMQISRQMRILMNRKTSRFLRPRRIKRGSISRIWFTGNTI